MLPSLASSACFPWAGPAFRLSLACCRRNLVTERRWNAVQQLTGLPANVLVALADFPGTPLCGACVPAVLPGLAAVAGPAESAAGRPAHVRPEACLLLKGCTVQAVCGVDESEALHKGPCLEQSRLRVLACPTRRQERWTSMAQPWRPATQRRRRTRRLRRRHAGHPGRGAAGAHTHHARKFFGALQQPELRGLSQLHGGRLPAGGLRHDPERLRLEHCAHLHPGAGDATPSAAGHGLQPGDVRQRGRQRLRGRHRHLPRHGLAGSLEHGAPGLLGAAAQNREASIPGLAQQSAGTLDLYSMQIRASAFEGDSVSVTDLLADSLALRARPRWTASPRRATWAATSCCATT